MMSSSTQHNGHPRLYFQLLRVNLTLAIVEMVYHEDVVHPAIPIGDNTSISLVHKHNEDNRTQQVMPNVTQETMTQEQRDKEAKFHWVKYAQNYILGRFFWGYVLTELPGGRLAEVIGARKVFGGGMLMVSLITFLTPLSCHFGYMVVVVLRTFVGLFLGTTFPATPQLPPDGFHSWTATSTMHNSFFGWG